MLKYKNNLILSQGGLDIGLKVGILAEIGYMLQECAMGVKIDQIDVPVCNSFRPKLIRDQFCYTVDLNEMKKKIKDREKLFFTFFIDYNEDRELSSVKDMKNTPKNTIIIETIGKKLTF